MCFHMFTSSTTFSGLQFSASIFYSNLAVIRYQLFFFLVANNISSMLILHSPELNTTVSERRKTEECSSAAFNVEIESIVQKKCWQS